MFSLDILILLEATRFPDSRVLNDDGEKLSNDEGSSSRDSSREEQEDTLVLGALRISCER